MKAQPAERHLRPPHHPNYTQPIPALRPELACRFPANPQSSKNAWLATHACIPRPTLNALVLALLWPAFAWADGVVTVADETHLRAAMAGGGTVTFACDGTIGLASTVSNYLDVVLDATGHGITISRAGVATGFFYVSSNVNFTLKNLTVANGGGAAGGGVLNLGGRVNLSGVAFVNNFVMSQNTAAFGGAIANQFGTLNLQNCSFTANIAYGGSSAAIGTPNPGFGGAIYNNGTMHANGCCFTNNSAGSSPSAPGRCSGGYAAGGAVYNLGVAVIDGCTFSGNLASGGAAQNGAGTWGFDSAGPAGGSADGGAILSGGQLTIRTSSFLNNRVTTGNGGNGDGTRWNPALPGKPGGGGGVGRGGALLNLGSASVASSTFFRNSAVGGAGGAGGPGTIGGTFPPTAGGSGGDGGDAQGAAVYNAGSIQLVNCTIAQNGAGGAGGGTGGYGGYGGGAGGSGGTGGSASGFIWSQNARVTLTNCSIAANSASAGSGGPGGPGGSPAPAGPPGANGTPRGCFQTPGGQLLNTLLSTNIPSNGPATVTDVGHNLSSDSSCLFTGPGSINNTDPRLGPLANNGGPTFTMALMPGSPAIDAGNTALAPRTDQRGYLRPAGAAADIGAYEFSARSNSPPVAGTALVKVIGEEVSQIPARRFLLWCSDPDNDPLTLTAVTSPSAMGALVTLQTNQVFYIPPVGFLGQDCFAYSITDGNGGFASGTAFIDVEPRILGAAVLLPPVTSPGSILVNFAGFADLSYTVERAESLQGPWTAIGNVLTDDNGAGSLADRNPPTGNAFYRAVHY